MCERTDKQTCNVTKGHSNLDQAAVNHSRFDGGTLYRSSSGRCRPHNMVSYEYHHNGTKLPREMKGVSFFYIAAQ